MMDKTFNLTKTTAWCPGCGNFGIRNALQKALNNMGLHKDEVIMVSGIGQAAKLPQYMDVNMFNGLHGRALPAAIGIKMANHHMKVLVAGGDGDGYGEGGNHLIHTIRRNVDLTQLVHDNQVYGLTKGQASPTTSKGQVQTYASEGSRNNQLHPLALALTLGAGFVARGTYSDPDQLAEIIQAAIEYRGYALIDILQPCVSFNKVNTHQWYQDRAKPIENHDLTDYDAAYKLAMTWGDEIPTGILYQVETDPYDERFGFLKDQEPLVDRELNPHHSQTLIDRLK